MSTSADAPDVVAGPELQEEPAGLPAPEETIFRLRQAILDGQHWFDALLEAVGRWRVAEEWVGDRRYNYLVGGEAFDWLLLGERLIDEIRDIVPVRETDALLFEGRWPTDVDDLDFAERLGPAKYSAHLNYLYGVLVEEALQLAVEEDIHKEGYARAWGSDPRADETMFLRVYGKQLADLKALYYEETKTMLGSEVEFGEWKAFTYWLFKTRMKRQDKARVASDTRKGLSQLTRMELSVSERRRGAIIGEEDFARRYGI